MRPSDAPCADGSHVRVAPFIVNNNPETMDPSRRSFATPQVGSSRDAAVADEGWLAWLRFAKPRALSCPDAEEPRSRKSRAPPHAWPRCAASPCPHAEEHRSAKPARMRPQLGFAAMRLEA